MKTISTISFAEFKSRMLELQQGLLKRKVPNKGHDTVVRPDFKDRSGIHLRRKKAN